MLCAVAKPGHRKNQSCVKKLCVAAARLLYLRDYQANTQYDAYHCTADQGLGALDLEVLIEINTECRSYHTLMGGKKRDQLEVFSRTAGSLNASEEHFFPSFTNNELRLLQKCYFLRTLHLRDTIILREKKTSYLQTTLISSKIGTSGNKISQFLFHLMMSIFHLVSITFSSNEK